MQNRIIGVVAPKGSGKTTVVTSDIVRAAPRVVIYDPMAATDLQYRMAATEIVVQDLTELRKFMAQDDFQILFEPKPPTQDGEDWYYSDFRPFIQICWRRAQLIGPMMVIIDEAHYTMSKKTMPLEMWNLITNGRRYGLDVVWITQRFVGVNGWVRANADEYWFFRLVHPADLSTVGEICGPEVLEQVRNLRRLDSVSSPVVPGQLLKWNSLNGSVEIIDLAERIPRKEAPDGNKKDEPKDEGRNQEFVNEPPAVT